MDRIFKAGPGSGFGKKRAQRYGEYLWKLRDENGDVLKPGRVVEEAKPESSPLHDYFEWDNKVASQKYRIFQARKLLEHIVVVVEVDGKDEDVRAFLNVAVKIGKKKIKQGYVTVREVQMNKEYHKIVVQNALDELRGWEKRYHQYLRLSIFKPLKPVFKAIKSMDKQISA